MKLRTVKKVIKEFMIKGRQTPMAKKVTLKNIVDFRKNKDKQSTCKNKVF